jgi:hypothetical protein
VASLIRRPRLRWQCHAATRGQSREVTLSPPLSSKCLILFTALPGLLEATEEKLTLDFLPSPLPAQLLSLRRGWQHTLGRIPLCRAFPALGPGLYEFLSLASCPLLYHWSPWSRPVTSCFPCFCPFTSLLTCPSLFSGQQNAFHHLSYPLRTIQAPCPPAL